MFVIREFIAEIEVQVEVEGSGRMKWHRCLVLLQIYQHQVDMKNTRASMVLPIYNHNLHFNDNMILGYGDVQRGEGGLQDE